MYPDPLLAQRLAVARLQELYREVEVEQARTWRDPAPGRSSALFPLLAGVGVVPMGLGAWLARPARGEAQPLPAPQGDLRRPATGVSARAARKGALKPAPAPDVCVGGMARRATGSRPLRAPSRTICILSLEPDGKLRCLSHGAPVR